MNKKAIVAAALLVTIGLIAFTAVMAASGWDLAKLSTEKYFLSAYEPSADFSDISIKTDTADIFILPSDDEKCKVVCYEAENAMHSVSAENGVLTVNAVDTRKWFEYIGINFETPTITVYLPENEYSSLVIKEKTGDIEISDNFSFGNIDISVSTGDVECFASAAETAKISTTTGDIDLENMSAGIIELSVSTGSVSVSSVKCENDIKVSVSTGKTQLTDITCRSVISRGSTGDILLKNVIAAEKFSIERSTGDVKFDASDASEIFVETDTGDVSGSLLTEKIFIAESDTGNVEVPKSVTGGRCEINSDTGDIRIAVKTN